MTIREKLKSIKKYNIFYASAFVFFLIFTLCKHYNDVIFCGNHFVKYIIALSFLILLGFASLLHLIDLTKEYWSNKYVKFGFVILFAYIGLYTDSASRLLIYKYVGENPDNFPVAINFLDAIYIYPNLVVFIVLLVVIISFIAAFIIPIQSLIRSKKIDNWLTRSIPAFVLSMVLLMLYISFYNKIDAISENLDRKTILLSSYYPNRTCTNKDLQRKYIKLIGINGKVSYTNITIFDLQNKTPLDFIRNMFYFDEKIEFNTTTCQK